MCLTRFEGFSTIPVRSADVTVSRQVFDKHNRGYIVASDLRAVLQCLGEDLSEEESK